MFFFMCTATLYDILQLPVAILCVGFNYFHSFSHLLTASLVTYA